jgi:hypothetical protein
MEKTTMRLKGTIAFSLCTTVLMLHTARSAHAQAGPPFLTNDPGTPGNGNWEINVGSMQTISRGLSSYQVPQIDLNFGLGDRIQFTYEIPHVLQTSSDRPIQSGWSNGYPGIKWRFLDEGEGQLQMSIFPQIETGASQLARQKGIAVAGPRYLLPLEVTKKIGEIDVDFEAGYYFPGNGPKERVLGLVAGRPLTPRLELDAEIYDDRPYDVSPHSTTLDFGGRYKLGRGLIALFMAGRSVTGVSDGRPEFIGYFGIQVLLSNYGLTFISE